MTFATLSSSFPIIMKIKRFFFNFSFSAAFLSFAATAPLMAELPTSPLAGEFTTSTNETVAGQSWSLEISSGGVWNILGDLAQVNWEYEGSNIRLLKGSGTINIGSGTEAGSLYMIGKTLPSGNWQCPVDFSGTVNVGKMGSFTFGGVYLSKWDAISNINTLNVNGGMVSIMSDTSNNSYFGIKNLSVSDDGILESELSIRTVDGGVWDLHSSGLSVGKVRVNSGSMTFNLHAENVLGNLPKISFDGVNVNCRMNVSADNSLSSLELNADAVLGLAVEDGATLTLVNLTTKNGASGVTGAKIVFYDYRADAFLIKDPNLSVEDSRLYIPSVDTYVDLEAYDGNGNLLEGEWSYEWDGAAGGMLVLTVPEPAAVAAVLGALALVFALRRKRK